jgi:hypothetical protein
VNHLRAISPLHEMKTSGNGGAARKMTSGS